MLRPKGGTSFTESVDDLPNWAERHTFIAAP